MFRKFAILTVLLAMTGIAHAKGNKCPLPKVSYTAQMRVTSKGAPGQPGGSMDAKVYVAGKRMRVEMKQAGMEVVAITDQQKKRVLMLMPQMKQYVETPLQKDALDPLRSAQECKLKRLGSETVSGIKTTKYQLKAKAKRMSTSGTIWLSKDNITVKLVGATKQQQDGQKLTVPVSVTLSKVKIGPIPDKQFGLPKGYSKASLPGMPGMQPAGK